MKKQTLKKLHNQRMILRCLRRGTASSAEIGQQVGITGDWAGSHLRQMREEGLAVSRYGTDEAGVGRRIEWAITEAGRIRLAEMEDEL